MDNLNWNDILRDIADSRAVLIIGQDFLPHAAETLHLDLYEKLTATPQHGIDYFYPQDGFFLFRSNRFKIQAQRNAADFYKSLQPDAALMQQIMDLPFRLIVSVNPDKALERAFRANNIEPQVGYFTWRPNRKAADLVEPAPDFPIIFNLFGSVEHYESLVLDYEDLFDHLKKLLNDENVPEVVQTILNETETYIFLGAKLEKWYTQLVFRYLNRKENHFDDKNKNYTVRPTFNDAETATFFERQFNVNYFGITTAFFQELHQRYAVYAAEMGDDAADMPPLQRIENAIADNKTAVALQILTANATDFDSDNRTQLILLKSQYAAYKQRARKQLALPNEVNIEHNQIKHRILEFAKTVF